MGTCISVASSNIQETENGVENLIIVQEILNSNGRTPSYLHSQVGSKGVNQDTAIMYQGYGMEDGFLCGIFDGHGKNGHIVSTLVRNRLPSLLLRQWNALATTSPEAKSDNNGDHENRLDAELMSTKTFREWKEVYVRAFKVMDKELKLNENLNCTCSGTTALSIVKQGEDLIIANLGDSRAVLGTFTDNVLMIAQLTTDLKPGLPKEAERIRMNNGRVFAHKEEPDTLRVWMPNEDSPGLAMTRAFGDFLLKDYGVIAIPEISYHHLTTNDQFLVLATDGVWDVLSNKQVASIVWFAESAEAAAKAIIDAAVKAWKYNFYSTIDDCTVACIFLQERQQNSLAMESQTSTSATQGNHLQPESLSLFKHQHDKRFRSSHI